MKSTSPFDFGGGRTGHVGDSPSFAPFLLRLGKHLTDHDVA